MKKLLILFVFCMFAFVSASIFPSISLSVANAEVARPTQSISSPSHLQDVVTNFSNYQNHKIVLENDLDMSDIVLKSTIGTDDMPFTGIFDGQGHTISNLKIDVSDEDQDRVSSQYASLFGRVQGAVIENVKIDGTTTLVTDENVSCYVSPLVGRAELNSQITHVQIEGQVVFQKAGEQGSFNAPNFDSSTFFGGVAGFVSNSQISYVVCRPQISYQRDWQFDRNDGHISTFGGVVGAMSNSSVIFCISEVDFRARVSETFEGQVRFGGVAGSVEGTGYDQRTILDVAMDNTFTIERQNLSSNAKVFVGEVCGFVSGTSAGSIAYVHYANTGTDKIGSTEYEVTDSLQITPALSGLSLHSLHANSEGGYDYFDKQTWDGTLGKWNFSTIFYVDTSGVANLQNFSKSFNVYLSPNLNTKVLSCNTTLERGYSYGQRVTLEFVFKKPVENGEVVADMKDFYRLSAITLGSDDNEISKVNEIEGRYELTENSDKYQIEKTESGFLFSINSIDMSTSGTYNFKVDEKQFSGTFTSRLYSDEGVLMPTVPGYVFPEGSANPDTVSYPLSYSTFAYDQPMSISTSEKPGGYAFEAWFLVVDGQDDIRLSSNSTLHIVFGHDGIMKDFEIYAKYNQNACTVSFQIDDGISRIELSSGQFVIDENSSVSISRRETSLQMEIFVKEGFFFDVNNFITEMDLYRGANGEQFCVYDSGESTEGQHYVFTLNMSVLRDKYATALPINARTTTQQAQSNNTIWFIVGGIFGGIVLILLVILIVFLIKRRGGGGRMKSVKGMYY